MRRDAATVLVWHLDLLKLVPVISASRERTVVFLHGIEAWRKLDLLTTRMLRKTDLFLSNSEHTWARFLRHHPGCERAAHRIVHLGLGDPVPGELPAPDRSPAALMVGRMNREENYKGHRELIAIWPRVLERLHDAQLWIVGEGDLRPDLERMVQDRGLSARVVFFGPVADTKKEELLQRSRALFMPSAGEGFGLVYAEAMRAGRPCLVSQLDAGREVVNPPEAGLAADLQNPDHLLECVTRLLDPGVQWDAMSARARARYEANFTARHFEQRLLTALFE